MKTKLLLLIISLAVALPARLPAQVVKKLNGLQDYVTIKAGANTGDMDVLPTHGDP